MASTPRWRAAVLEVATIVLGISIALAADAAWDNHVERQDEQLALARLYDDFASSAELLAGTKSSHEAELAAAETLLGLIASAGDPAGSYQVSDSVLWAVRRTTGWSPPTGAVTSLINSGEIRIIRSDSLRTELTAWMGVVTKLAEAESQARRHYEAFQLPISYEYVPYARFGAQAETEGVEGSSRLQGDYERLLNSLPFENAIQWRVGKEREILVRYEDMEDRLERILGLVERAREAS